jgi:hypothetical protein
MQLHQGSVRWDGPADPETDALVRDLLRVWNSVHQGMVVYGPWFETRLSNLIRGWLPQGWTTSGPAQVYCPDRPGLRSRSWDIIVHRTDVGDVPPEAFRGAGWPLVPRHSVALVIDAKTNFSTPAAYARQATFNLMNDSGEPQLAFLGSSIVPVVLAVTSSMSPDAMEKAGAAAGLRAFSLGRYRAGPVSDGEERLMEWVMQAGADGDYPYQRFKRTIIETVAAAG